MSAAAGGSTELTAFVREVVLPGAFDDEPTIDPRFCSFRLASGRSAIHRWGLFAAEDIPRRRRVIEYKGERIGRREIWRRRLRRHVYIFWTSANRALDGGIGGSGAERINHSCEPNLYANIARGRIHLVSTRPIPAGEELTLDYRLRSDHEVPCHCGSRACRGVINLPD